MKKLVVFACLCGLSLLATEVKLLTIGNSFADSVFVFLPQCVQSAGDTIVMDRANIGGCPLEKHWKLAEKSEADPNAKTYPQGNPKFTLQERLQEKKWDFVTIQQASGYSWKVETYQPYASNLQALVKRLAPQAELLIQQTWAYRFDESRLPQWKIDQQTMYEKLTAAYKQIAGELGIRMIPTGNAVQLARETQPVKYVPYDKESLKKLKYPDPLPSEAGSFVNGNRWQKTPVRDGKALSNADARAYWKQKEADRDPAIKVEWRLTGDRAHLNARGQYLQACVWYGMLFNKPVSNITFVPKNLTPEDCAFLRQVAQKALDANAAKK